MKFRLDQILFFVVLLCSFSINVAQNKNDSDAKEIIKYEGEKVPSSQLDFFDRPPMKLARKFEPMIAGEIMPKGWILNLMTQDITKGFVAHLDNLAPDILKEDDLFGTTRRNSMTDIPDVGDHVLKGEPWEISMQWWSGETKGVWWEGYIRHAFLTENEEAINRSHEIIRALIDSQDQDGYIGIYGPERRYQHDGSNGELWAQTGAFKAMMVYYEYTKDKQVLDAVERAMKVTMRFYGDDAESPFNLSKPEYGGVTHGLMMTDVCERLERLTGKQIYQDYAVYLYKEFSSYRVNRSMDDMRYENLMKKEELFQSHSVHTYEHFRPLLNSYFETGYPELQEAYQSALNKLSKTVLPSGAGFGNEWLNAQESDPNTTAAEFCGMYELREFYTSAAGKTGKSDYADRAEKLTFNAILGARNEDGTAITYCKTDNCYVLNQKAPQHGFHEEDPRYKYSPTHADAAVCCNPNYARNFPDYIEKMWMVAEDGLAAILYGPSEVTTSFQGADVNIIEKTNYPLSDTIEFEIHVSDEVEMALYFRVPGFSKSIEVDGIDKVGFENGFLKINKRWKGTNSIKLSLENEVEIKGANDGSVYFQRGPLVYAYEIPSKFETVKEYSLTEFSDYNAYPTNRSFENLSFKKENYNDEFDHEFSKEKDIKNPWRDNGTFIVVKLTDTSNGNVMSTKLIPMGNTVLRRVTFPLSEE